MRGWGGGAGGPLACRLLPGRSRCPRAGPAARHWAEVGCRGWGSCFLTRAELWPRSGKGARGEEESSGTESRDPTDVWPQSCWLRAWVGI